MTRRKLSILTIAAVSAVAAALAGSVTASQGSPVKARDTLVMAVQELGTTQDPKTYQAASMIVLQGTQEPLVAYKFRTLKDSDDPVFDAGKFEGGVVQSWGIAPDGKSINMTLRKGVKSIFGNTLTTADVDWTTKRNIALKTLGAGFTFGQTGIDPANPLTIIDAQKFRWNLKNPSPNLLRGLAFHWESPFDSTEAKKHATDSDPWASDWLSTHSASFGPYSIESYVPGQSATLVANPNYWAGKPPLKKIVIRVVPDPGNRQQLLERGVVQLVPDLPRVQLAKLAGNKKVKIENVRSTRMLYLVTNNKSKPFDNRLVRQAMAWAVPYADIVKQAYKGTATVVSGPVSPLFTDFHIAKLWRYKTDLAKAKALLTQAGYPSGFSVALQYSLSNPGPENAQVAVLIQAALKKIGVTVELQQATSDAVLFADLLAKKVPFGLGGTAPFIPDAGYQLYNTGSINAPSAFGAYDNPEFESIMLAANSTTDPTARARALSAAQALWARDIAMVPILEPNVALAMDPKLTGYRGQPTGFPFLRYFAFTE